jgi:hypothetical protein
MADMFNESSFESNSYARRVRNGKTRGARMAIALTWSAGGPVTAVMKRASIPCASFDRRVDRQSHQNLHRSYFPTLLQISLPRVMLDSAVLPASVRSIPQGLRFDLPSAVRMTFSRFATKSATYWSQATKRKLALTFFSGLGGLGHRR